MCLSFFYYSLFLGKPKMDLGKRCCIEHSFFLLRNFMLLVTIFLVLFSFARDFSFPIRLAEVFCTPRPHFSARLEANYGVIRG